MEQLTALRPLTARAPRPAGALLTTTVIAVLPSGILPILAAALLLLGVASYAWWYHAGQPAGFAATRDEIVADVRAARDRFDAAWQWIARKRRKGRT